jgi:hypothetical protein
MMEVIGIVLMFFLIGVPVALIIGGSRAKRVSIFSENYRGPRRNQAGSATCPDGLCTASRNSTLTGGFNEAYRSQYDIDRQKYFEDIASSSSQGDDGETEPGNALATKESQAETQKITREEYPTIVEKTSTGPAVVHVRIGRK